MGSDIVSTTTDASTPFPVYTTTEMEHELRQGEIISNVLEHVLDPSTGEFQSELHNFVVIGTQDCDLLQDFKRRSGGKNGNLSGILMYEADLAANLKSNIGGKDLWKPVSNNINERYHLLEEVPLILDLQKSGIASLIIDIKRVFTLPVAELERQLGLQAARRTRLEMPYREHLQIRIAAYSQRIGVPRPHRSP